MPKGKIISFKDDRGYGFIAPDDGSANVYLHISALEKAGIGKISVNDEISYELHHENDKISAIDIRKL